MKNIIFNKYITQPFYYKNAFTKEECERILTAPYDKKMSEGNHDYSLRVTNSKYLTKTDDNRWILEKIYQYVQLVNTNYYKFKLSHIDDVHIMEYQKDCFFKWHIDMNGQDYFAMRKISIVIFLSDRNDYEGGQLLFDVSDQNETPQIEMEQGSIILFPSFQIHKVSDIKSGIRNTLVAWVYGDSFS